jgi:hypothetical protein
MLRFCSTLAAAALMLASGCSTTRALAPLAKGQHGVTMSVGGPFVQFGGPIPVPISSIGYKYGIDGHGDFHTAFYPTQLALFNVWGLDVGISRELVTAKGARPRLMVDMTHYFFWGDNRGKNADNGGGPPGGFRWFPDISAVVTWDVGKDVINRPHRLYLGVDTFFQTIPGLHVYPSPMLGTELRASKVVAVQLELAWNAPWKDTTFANPVWYGPGNYGAVAVRLGLNFYVPQKKHDNAQTLSQPSADDIEDPVLTADASVAGGGQ